MRIADIFILSMLLVLANACRRDVEDPPTKLTIGTLTFRTPVDSELVVYFNNLENHVRRTRAIDDTVEIMRIIQNLIDEGSAIKPFIFTTEDSALVGKFVSYAEFKEFVRLGGDSIFMPSTLPIKATLTARDSIPYDSSILELQVDDHE